MDIPSATYVQESEALKKEALLNIIKAITDIVENVAVVVWLIDKDYCLVAKAQLNAGDIENKWRLRHEENDFVSLAFSHASAQERDDLASTEDFLFGEYAQSRRWKSGLAHPIQTTQFHFGVLGVYTIGHQGFTDKERRQIEAIANLIATNLEIQHRSTQIEGLFELARSTTNRTSLQQTLIKIAEIVQRLLVADFVDIYPWNALTETFEAESSVIYPQTNTSLPIPKLDGASYRILESDTPLAFHQDETPEFFTQLENDLNIHYFWGTRMMANGQPVGVFHVNYIRHHSLSEDAQEVLLTLANNAAVAIREAKLFERVSYQAVAFEKLSQVFQTLTSLEEKQQNYRELLQQIVDSAKEVLGADTITLYEYFSTTGQFELPPIKAGDLFFDHDITQIHLSDPLFELIKLDKPLYIPEAQDSTLSQPRKINYESYPNERYIFREKIISSAVVPLVAEKQATGLLFINYRSYQSFPDELRNITEAFAGQAAIAIRNTRLYRDISRKSKNLEALNKFGQRLTAGARLSSDKIVEQVFQEIADLVNPTDFYVLFYDEGTDTLYPGKMLESSQRQNAHRSLKLPAQYTSDKRTLTKEVIYKREMINLNRHQEVEAFYQQEGHQDPDYQDGFQGQRGPRQASYLGVPIMAGDEIHGIISLSDWDKEYAFDNETVKVIATLASQAAIALDNATLYYRRVRGLSALNQTGQKLTAQIKASETEIIELIYQQVKELTQTTDMFIALYDNQTREIRFPLFLEHGHKRSIEPRLLDENRIGKTENVIITQKPILHKTQQASKTWYNQPGRREEPGGILPSSSLTVPMIVADKVIGAIGIYDIDRENVYDEIDIEVFSTMASQAAIALQNANLLERQQALVEIALELASERDRDTLFQEILERSLQLLKCKVGSIALVSQKTGELVVKYAIGAPLGVNVPLDKGLMGRAAQTQQPVRVGDVTQEPHYIIHAAQTRSELDVPMLVRNQLIGVLNFESPHYNAFNTDDEQIATALASQAAIALDNSSLYYDINQQLERQVEGLHTLNEIGQQLTSAIKASEDEIIQLISEKARELTQSEDLYITFYDEQTKLLQRKFYLEHGQNREFISRPLNQEANRGKKDEIILTGKPILLRTRQEIEDWHQQPGHRSRVPDPWLSYLGVPMILADEAVGVIAVFSSDRENAYDELDLGIFQTMANQAAVALDKARLYQKLEQQVEGLETLNKVGQRLTSAIEASEEGIINSIYEEAKQLTEWQDMYIALYDEVTDEISFPLYVSIDGGGKEIPKQVKTRPLDREKKGKTEEIILSKQPLLHKTKQESVDWYRQPGRQEFVGVIPPSWLGAPMIAGNKVIGVIAIYDMDQEYFYDETDLEIFLALANQAAIALENARLYDIVIRKLEQQVHGLETLNNIGQKLTSAIKASEKEIINSIYEEAKQLTEWQDMYVALYDEMTDKISFPLYVSKDEKGKETYTQIDPRPLDIEKIGKTEEIILSKQPLLHKTRQESIDWYKPPSRQEFVGTIPSSWLGVPMIAGNKVIGVIAIYETNLEYFYNETDQKIFQALANQAAIALENSTLYRNLDQSLRHKNIVQTIANAVRTYTEPDKTLQAILDETNFYLQAEAISFQTMDDSTRELVIQGNLNSTKQPKHERIEVQELQQKTLQEGSTYELVYYRKLLTDAPSELVVPIRDRQEKFLGIFLLEHTQADYFDEEKQELAWLIADQAGIIIQQTKMTEEANRNSQLAALGAAMAAIQHRINNTINLVPPNMALLKLYLDSSNPKISQPLDIIERNVAYTSQYIKKIQNFLKESDIVLHNIGSLLLEAHKTTQQQYRDKQEVGEVLVNFEQLEDCYAKVPISQITEVFTNVIENSYKAMAKMGGELIMSVSSTERDILIKIENSGPVIPEEKLKKLLEKPVPPKDQREGTGLGLWLSRILLQRHGGNIVIDNRKSNDGVVVIISLPISTTP